MKLGQKKDQSKSPDYGSNQAIIKSQKILNTVSNYHMKTQQQRNQQEHRSPEPHRNDKQQMRQTWKHRPRMHHTNKLPDVFNQPNAKKKQQANKVIKQELMRNFDLLVENNEYKQTQKYLQPLKFDKKQQDKKKDIGENRNPLIPFRKYMIIANKFTEDLNQDISLEKFKLPPKFTHQNIKINECVTLQVIKRGHNTGTVKKMLHVPSMKLTCVRQQPLNSKESRNLIRDWVSMWQSKLNSQDLPFVNIYYAYFNYPEGAVSILTEYFQSGSLLNLLTVTLTLPESVIRQIFIEVIKHISLFYSITDLHFGGISPSQIMFAANGQIKLGMGLFYHIPNMSMNNMYFLRGQQKTNLFDFNSTHSKFMKNSIDKNINLQIQRAIDVFKLGFIMLQCAIGIFQNFQQSPIVFENLKYVFTQQGQKQVQRQNACCLIHSENYLLQLSNPTGESDRTKRDKTDLQKLINYIRLLKDRFSIHFINFLCLSLKLSHSKRATIHELQNHSFIQVPHDNDNRTVKISLSDLLYIGRGDNQDKFFQSGTEDKMDKFIGHLIHVLYGCKKQILVDLLKYHKEKLYELGRQIGMNPMALGKKLQQTISQMIKGAKN